jgi:hypothetical protein
MADPFLRLLNNINKTRYSVKNGKSFLTRDDLIEIYNNQQGKCFWFNVALIPHEIFDKNNPNSMSVDRIDNKKGYTKDNIVITTRAANLARNETLIDDFKMFINKLRCL